MSLRILTNKETINHPPAMIKTFHFETKTSQKFFIQTIYAIDLETSVQKWIDKINLLKDQVYSFDATAVKEILEQFVLGKLRQQLNQQPYFVAFTLDSVVQVCYIYENNKGLPDFVAQLSYISTEEGGRKGYVASGYRASIQFEGKDFSTPSEQLFIDKDNVFPGETVKAEMRIIAHDVFANFLFPGLYFEVCEGAKLVARGKIVEVINPNLAKFPLDV